MTRRTGKQSLHTRVRRSEVEKVTVCRARSSAAIAAEIAADDDYLCPGPHTAGSTGAPLRSCKDELMSRGEVGAILGLSHERIRQIELGALRKLRLEFERLGLSFRDLIPRDDE